MSDWKFHLSHAKNNFKYKAFRATDAVKLQSSLFYKKQIVKQQFVSRNFC